MNNDDRLRATTGMNASDESGHIDLILPAQGRSKLPLTVSVSLTRLLDGIEADDLRIETLVGGYVIVEPTAAARHDEESLALHQDQLADGNSDGPLVTTFANDVPEDVKTTAPVRHRAMPKTLTCTQKKDGYVCGERLEPYEYCTFVRCAACRRNAMAAT